MFGLLSKSFNICCIIQFLSWAQGIGLGLGIWLRLGLQDKKKKDVNNGLYKWSNPPLLIYFKKKYEIASYSICMILLFFFKSTPNIYYHHMYYNLNMHEINLPQCYVRGGKNKYQMWGAFNDNFFFRTKHNVCDFQVRECSLNLHN